MKSILDIVNFVFKLLYGVIDVMRPRILVVGLAILLTACAQGSSNSSDSNDSSDTSDTSGSNPVNPPKTMVWVAPTTYTDGTPLVSLDKYRIYYGGSENGIKPIMEIPNVGNSYDFTDSDRNFLKSMMGKNDKHFFAISTVDGNGVEGLPSESVIYDAT